VIKVAKEYRKFLAPLFEGWEETLIWSCLQGEMGTAWSDGKNPPRAAQIIIGDFCFFAGDAASVEAEALVQNLPVQHETRTSTVLFLPQDEAWAELIVSVYGKRAQRGVRYATKKEPDVFDREMLESFRYTLPEHYRLTHIDREIYDITKQEDWAFDFCSQFESFEDYQNRGAGFAVMCGDELAAGASSYTVYHGGIEIEIDTKLSHRRKGLALACASALILHCLDHGLYPSWDAANLASVSLAEKLGYHFSHEYPYFAIEREETVSDI